MERSLRASVFIFAVVFQVCATAKDALAVKVDLRGVDMPLETGLDPIFASPASSQVPAFTRCGDSALWTGVYLAAESFRDKATGSTEALDNARAAFKVFVDEKGNNTLHYAPDSDRADSVSGVEVVVAFLRPDVAYPLVDGPPLTSTLGKDKYQIIHTYQLVYSGETTR